MTKPTPQTALTFHLLTLALLEQQMSHVKLQENTFFVCVCV